MQDIVFYVAAKETHGIVRDSANANNLSAPNLVLGVSVCLKMRLFAACNVATAYPVASFSGITDWKWRMDADFDRDTPSKLVADTEDISVQTVTDTVGGETLSFTEFTILISDMNTQELASWLGNQRKRSGLIGELVGYDSGGNAVFVLQIDDFTVWNRVAGLADPTTLDQEVLTRSETMQLIQTAVSSSAATKQDKLTSANAGTNISIDDGTISNTYSLPAATNSGRGGVVLATGAEIVSGTDTGKAVTPAALKSAFSSGQQFVPREAVSAFMSITDLGASASATLTAGKAYKLVATNGNHALTTIALPALSFGADSFLELFVGITTLIHVSDPLILMDALVPNAVNNCVIKFRESGAYMYVEDYAYGYVVTVAGGTSGTQLEGSLYYGMSGSTVEYVTFANSMNGSTCDLGGAVTNGEKHVVGNGYFLTAISGGVSCTSKTTFANLTMDNVSILGGTTTLSDVYIPNGATVSVSGGGLAVEKVAGSGTIDLGGTNIFVGYKEAMQVEGCVFAGGSASSNGIITASSATIVLKDVTFSSNTVAGSVIYCSRTPFSISGCRIDGTVNAANTCITDFSDGSLIENSFVSGSALAIYTTDPHLAISGSTIGLIILRGGTIYLGGVNNIEKITSQNASRFGDVVVSSGASVNLTSGIVPGGRITVLDGGCTVNGVSVPGGTYSTITSDAGSDIIVT